MTDTDCKICGDNYFQHGLFELNVFAAISTAANVPRSSNRRRRKFGVKTAKCLDDFFFEAVKTLDIPVLMECGAHEGSASLRFKKEKGRVAIAIEANPFVFEDKTRILKQHNIIALNSALDSQDGKVTLKVPAGKQKTSTKGSILARTDLQTQEIDCEARTLDSITSEFVSEDDSLALWIDVEGAAEQVLRGSNEILGTGRCKILKIEMESISFWKNQSRSIDIDTLLQGFGYIPIARDSEYKNQYNVVYASKESYQALESLTFAFWQKLRTTKLSPIEWIAPISIGRNRAFSESGGIGGLLKRKLSRHA